MFNLADIMATDRALDSLIKILDKSPHDPIDFRKNQLIHNCLRQLQTIRKRKCEHEWEYAQTISNEGIVLKGFHACFKCDKIRN